MPLEIQLNAIGRTYFMATTRNSTFLIEERHEQLETGERWSWYVVGVSANYGDWILNQMCSMPELGHSLIIKTTDPVNDVVITTRLRTLRKLQ